VVLRRTAHIVTSDISTVISGFAAHRTSAALLQQAGWLVGWLVFNGCLSTDLPYLAIFAQEINPTPYLL